MRAIGGYAGNVLCVDLGKIDIVQKPLRVDLMKQLLGGSGINAQLAHKTIKPASEPFSPGNALIFGVGPFVGTLVPGAGKSCSSSKSPNCGRIDISVTGSLGNLKFAGYDHLVVTGKADKPVYLKIWNEKVEIVDGRHLWGKDIFDTTEEIWGELGKEYTVLAIGPAGENRVVDANIMADKYSGFSRGGLGAVMGSKNLKAIAVYGTKDITVAHPDQFEELLAKLQSEFYSQPLLAEWRKFGSLVSLKPMATTGLYAHRNYQEAVDPESMVSGFSLDRFLALKAGDVACMSCPIGCKHFIRIAKGKHEGLTLSVGCANAAMQAWGSYCGSIGEWEDVFKGADLCNRLGLDWYDTASLISWAIELYQRGIIDKNVTDGIELDWGNAVAIQDLIQKIAHKRGLGGILAHGLREAPEIIGKNSRDYVVHINGLSPPFDPRARISTESFSQFVNVRGGHSVAVTVTMMPRSRGQMRRYAERTGLPPADVVDRVLTGPEEFNPGRMSRWFEDNVSILDSLGLCQFPPFQRFNLSLLAEVYSALTGIDMDAARLLQAGERASNLRQAFNLRESTGDEGDLIPRRFVAEPLRIGVEKRAAIREDDIRQLIDDYNDERGWNKDGTIPKERIEALELDQYLGREGLG